MVAGERRRPAASSTAETVMGSPPHRTADRARRSTRARIVGRGVTSEIAPSRLASAMCKPAARHAGIRRSSEAGVVRSRADETAASSSTGERRAAVVGPTDRSPAPTVTVDRSPGRRRLCPRPSFTFRVPRGIHRRPNEGPGKRSAMAGTACTSGPRSLPTPTAARSRAAGRRQRPSSRRLHGDPGRSSPAGGPSSRLTAGRALTTTACRLRPEPP